MVPALSATAQLGFDTSATKVRYTSGELMWILSIRTASAPITNALERLTNAGLALSKWYCSFKAGKVVLWAKICGGIELHFTPLEELRVITIIRHFKAFFVFHLH